jgi:hypothetical protein
VEDKLATAVVDAKALIEAYLEAFAACDVPRSMAFYADDAVLKFVSGVYNTRAAIEDWHKERFALDVKVLRIDSITVKDDTVKVDLMVASKRLQFYRISSLAARATIRLKNGLIGDVHFGPRFTDPFEGW